MRGVYCKIDQQSDVSLHQIYPGPEWKLNFSPVIRARDDSQLPIITLLAGREYTFSSRTDVYDNLRWMSRHVRIPRSVIERVRQEYIREIPG